jgi:molybdenum cofactor cytidylyltransferase
MISGIVLAAGASSRMGQAKAALPIGSTGQTVVARVIQTLLDAGVPRVVVVAGAHIDAVRQAMPSHELRATVIEHPGWEQGQLSSLLAGLQAIDDPQLEGALVTLVDVPMVSAATVAEVMAAWRRTRAPIVRPARGERHGHPVIFDRSVFADLRSADPTVGAKAVFATHKAHVLNVEVNDPGAF